MNLAFFCALSLCLFPTTMFMRIPYCSKSYDMAFLGMGRFVGAIVPMHLVLGQILSRMPAPLAAVALSLSAALLAAYAALFAAGYTII